MLSQFRCALRLQFLQVYTKEALIFYVCPVWAWCNFPLIPSLPHLLLYLLVSFTFPLFSFLLASSIFLLFHPFPFYIAE